MNNSSPSDAQLDAIFTALADPTRRAILRRLKLGPASVGDLADPFDMSQPAVSRHLKMLESAGLITRKVDRQKRPATLAAEPLALASGWISEFEAFWTQNFNRLDTLLETLQTEDSLPDTPANEDSHK